MGKHPFMSRRLLAVAASAALLLSACSGNEEEPLTQLPKVERSAEANPDRDAHVVADKAAAVDPCALLRAADSAKSGAPRTSTSADRPHSCWTVGGSAKADVWSRVSEADRFSMARLELSSAVAYRERSEDGRCLIHLPVSHNYAISFSGTAKCAVVTAHAKAAARLLRDHPEQATRPVGLQRVSACQMIKRAGGTPQTYTGGSHYSRLDECLDESSATTLILEYDDGELYDYQTPHDVAGTEVRVQESRDGDRCFLHWTLGEADVSVSETNDKHAVWAIAKNCKKGLEFAEKVIRTASAVKSPRRDPVGLLYSTDEPDTSAVGACADVVEGTEQCLAAEEAQVPDDPRERIMEAEADPNVLCAAATTAVREQFGDSLSAVTVPASSLALIGPEDGTGPGPTECVFGQPDHAVEISVRVSTGTPGGTKDGSVGGRAARIDERGDSRLWVIARGSLQDPGFVAVEVRVRHPRGTQPPRWTGQFPEGSPVTEPLEKSEALVEALADDIL